MRCCTSLMNNLFRTVWSQNMNIFLFEEVIASRNKETTSGISQDFINAEERLILRLIVILLLSCWIISSPSLNLQSELYYHPCPFSKFNWWYFHFPRESSFPNYSDADVSYLFIHCSRTYGHLLPPRLCAVFTDAGVNRCGSHCTAGACVQPSVNSTCPSCINSHE